MLCTLWLPLFAILTATPVCVIVTGQIQVKGQTLHVNPSHGHVPVQERDRRVTHIHDAMVALTCRTLTTQKLRNDRCDVVLIYDELLTYPVDIAAIWRSHQHQHQHDKENGHGQGQGHVDMDLDHDIPLLLTINLQGDLHPAPLLASYLHALYRIQNCYVFMVWVTDPRILYPPDMNLHPGWRNQDYVIIALHHLAMTRSQQSQLIQHRFWKEMPNIIGLKVRNTASDYVSVFTVLPYMNMNGGVRTREIDVWNVNTGTFGKEAPLFWDKFTTLHSTSLTIGISWKEPFQIWGDKENPYFDGLDWRLLRLVSHKLNFTLKYHFVNGTGRRSEVTRTWSGLMGELERGAADFGAGGISISPRRLEDFGFCRSYWTDSYTFISPLNKSRLNTLRSLTEPFNWDVWVAIGISGLLAIVLMKVFAKVELESPSPKQGQRPKKPETAGTAGARPRSTIAFATATATTATDVWFKSVMNNVYVLWSLFLQRSFRHVPKSNAVRCIYISTSFTFFILGIVFGGGLYARLLAKRDDISIDHPRDMRPSGLQVYARDYDGHLNDYAITNPKMQKQWDENTHFVQANETWVTINEVVRGRGIFIDSRAKLTYTGQYNYAGVNGFKFHMSSFNFLRVNIGWPTRKNWPLKKNIDDILIRVVESGVVQYWMSHFMRGKFGFDNEAYRFPKHSTWFQPRENSTRNVDPSVFGRNFDTLTMEQYGGIVGVWVGGLLISTIVFFMEVVSNCMRVSARFGKEFCRFVKKEIASKMKQIVTGGKGKGTSWGRRPEKLTLKHLKKRQNANPNGIVARRIFVRTRDQNGPTDRPAIIW